jgi:radical SAM superfamily enzyme YgiQ (UPF0313 family)
MKLMFIFPCVGRKKGESYPKGWCMEPLSIAVLSALTPNGVEKVFYDDRIDAIPYDEPADLVCIGVETYTARRAYAIAAEFRKRRRKVIMGGFHATLNPDEAARHADSILVGEAESVWGDVMADLAGGRLRPRYRSDAAPGRQAGLNGVLPDRSIYADKDYARISLMETSRGCRFNCDFCVITQFFRQRHGSRPLDDVLREIGTLPHRNIFFVDDNIGMDRVRFKTLLRALIPLKIRWAAQVSLHIAEDRELLGLMRDSGCILVLIGFESLNPAVLRAMGKRVNGDGRQYDERLKRFRDHGIGIYAAFVFGYDGDTEDAFRQTLDFALRNRVFFAAFNHLTPFPGTPLYRRLKAEDRLIDDPWWLSPSYRFGQAAFRPRTLSPERLTELCHEYRRTFYRWSSIARRGLNIAGNCGDPFKAFIYLYGNAASKFEVRQRRDLPLGVEDAHPSG